MPNHLEAVSTFGSFLTYRTDCRVGFTSSFKLPALVATALVVATLGDVLLARCSGSSLRVNLLPTYLVRELAAKLGGYGATQSALGQT